VEVVILTQQRPQGNTTTAPTTLGTPGSYNCISGNLTALGSTALQPLAVAVSKLYSAKCTGATIAIQGGGSGAGLTAVKGGNVAIGNSDLYADPTKYGTDLVDHQVAVVVFSVVVNRESYRRHQPDLRSIEEHLHWENHKLETGKWS